VKVGDRVRVEADLWRGLEGVLVPRPEGWYDWYEHTVQLDERTYPLGFHTNELTLVEETEV
jgi:hypothetical protein